MHSNTSLACSLELDRNNFKKNNNKIQKLGTHRNHQRLINLINSVGILENVKKNQGIEQQSSMWTTKRRQEQIFFLYIYLFDLNLHFFLLYTNWLTKKNLIPLPISLFFIN